MWIFLCKNTCMQNFVSRFFYQLVVTYPRKDATLPKDVACLFPTEIVLVLAPLRQKNSTHEKDIQAKY